MRFILSSLLLLTFSFTVLSSVAHDHAHNHDHEEVAEGHCVACIISSKAKKELLALPLYFLNRTDIIKIYQMSFIDFDVSLKQFFKISNFVRGPPVIS